MIKFPIATSYRLAVSAEAESDVQEIRNTDPETADFLLVILEWIGDRGDQIALLNEHGHGADRGVVPKPVFQVSKWLETWKGREPESLWRLKLWSLEDQGIQYRVIYGYQIGSRTFWILGIVHRDFAYDSSHPKNQRILDQARKLQKL